MQILHEKIHDRVIAALVDAYEQVPIGDPLKRTVTGMIGKQCCAGRSQSKPRIHVVGMTTAGTLCGPLHTRRAVEDYQRAVETVPQQVWDLEEGCGLTSKASSADTWSWPSCWTLGARRAAASFTVARCSRTGPATL